MNVLDMKEFSTGTFNIVFDKGTLDSVLCGDDSVNDVTKMLSEVYRVLAPGGKYICVSYGDQAHRKKHFETQSWSNINVDKVQKPSTNPNNEENDVKNFHYIYTMTKPK